MIAQNTAYTIVFNSMTTAGAENDSTTPATYVSHAGAAFASTTNTPTSLGHGAWSLALTAAEMNSPLVSVSAIASGCVPGLTNIATEATYTSTIAGYLDTNISTRATPAQILKNTAYPILADTNGDVTANNMLTTAAIATAVAADILRTPANLLATDASGDVTANNMITVAAIAAAILRTPADLLTTDASGYVTYNNPAPDNADISLIVAVTNKLATMLQAVGSNYQYTSQALALAPSGGGGGGFTGPDSVTFTFEDSLGNPVSGVAFYVAGVGGGISNGSGQFTGGMAAGSYVLTASNQNGLLFPVTSFTVSGATNVLCQAVVPSIPAPGPAGTCVIYLYVINAAGTPLSGVSATLTISSDTKIPSGQWVQGATYTQTSGSNGEITFNAVPIGSQAVVAIASLGIQYQFTVPNEATYQI